jgi:molybdopterin-guanine dinucleotide biosynthesis protein A
MSERNSEKGPMRSAQYHDFEVSICGFSGTGKTTLCTRLIEQLRVQYKVGFVKSDAHSFQMDKAGKDTARAWEAGAESVSIFDQRHFAMLRKGSWDMIHRRTAYENDDFVLVEGRKQSVIAKLVMLGGDQDILKAYPAGELEPVLGYIGTDHTPPPGLLRPYFQRDSVTEIGQFIVSYFQQRSPERPLHGLVLSGGESRRMQKDKALIEINGQTQLMRATGLLREKLDQVYISTRPGQRSARETSDTEIIEDRLLNFGPVGGIISALLAKPNAAFLVVACDLPLLSGPVIENLIQHRDAMKFATGFLSSRDGLPEPLCAIYEPRILPRLLAFIGMGYVCPRKVLLNSACRLLPAPQADALFNMNFPSDLQAALKLNETRGL